MRRPSRSSSRSDGERIPRLADVFALVERSGNRTVRFNIETKIDPMHPEQTVSAARRSRAALSQAIRDAGMASRVTVQSFDWRTLRLLGALAPEIALVALTDQQPDEDTIEIGKPGASPWLGELDVDDHGGSVPKLVQALGAKTWSPHARDLTPGARRRGACRSASRSSRGRSTTRRTWRLAIALGVDGLITDYPDRLRAVLESKGIAVPPPTPVK